MLRFLQQLKRAVQPKPPTGKHASPRRRDSQFVGGTNVKDIERASPERGPELAGHPPERVET
jgi:hypothetical protein